MKTIGITGGVGAGKSLVLDYIKNHYRAKIYMADEIANFLKEPGQSCYEPICSLLGREILDKDGKIHKGRMAEKIFRDTKLLQAVNGIIHPAVKVYVLSEIDRMKKEKECDFFILEAALLIEEHYDEILDELWYVYADEATRSERLKVSRQYSDEKIQNIMKNQMTDDVFRKHCQVIIENNGDLDKTYGQIDEKLGEYINAENK